MRDDDRGTVVFGTVPAPGRAARSGLSTQRWMVGRCPSRRLPRGLHLLMPDPARHRPRVDRVQGGEPMTTTDWITELRRLVEAATPGPCAPMLPDVLRR